jgi:hypothetical protein
MGIGGATVTVASMYDAEISCSRGDLGVRA